MDSNSEENNDDELAPMVDGLSGALCVLILITTVFMLSATDTVMAGFNGYGFKFPYSSINMSERKLTFNGGINISYQDVYLIRKDIESLDETTIYIYIPDYIENRNNKMVFNLNEFRKRLNLKKM
ncbi:hypothetical protein NI387_02750 [Vibrio parahaemolyticus]|uniref:hypothetical protein n=1 Tax=Vibrio parahaemolyticus TaxID=670 RepID=UPI0027E50C81|nr:hypothetical protein [Vibrio parahaemolyticus]WMN68755.1 hypothetical protein NI387_02750 [Vibrio parahaemolyticus]